MQVTEQIVILTSVFLGGPEVVIVHTITVAVSYRGILESCMHKDITYHGRFLVERNGPLFGDIFPLYVDLSFNNCHCIEYSGIRNTAILSCYHKVAILCMA